MLKKLKNSAEKKLRRATELMSDTAKETGKFLSTTSKGAKEIVAETATMENVKKIGTTVSDVATKENIIKAGTVISDAATLENAKSAAKYASGVKGYKEMKEAKQIKKQAEKKINDAAAVTEYKKKTLNEGLESYADDKINTIKKTICVFVEYLKEIGQKNKGREYEALRAIDIKQEDISDIEELGVSSVNLAKGTAGSASLGLAAALGVKMAVVKGVMAIGAASTGTAISSLSGAAAINATYAWIGGGAISSGGGGMATGSMILGGIGAGAFASVAALSGGILLSAHGAKALTMATKYSAEVDKAVAALENSWVAMDGIMERVKELKDLNFKLEKRALDELNKLEPIVPNFDTDNMQHKEVFQKTALLMKSIGEIANTQILDENGSVTEISGAVVGKIKSVLNTKAS